MFKKSTQNNFISFQTSGLFTLNKDICGESQHVICFKCNFLF